MWVKYCFFRRRSIPRACDSQKKDLNFVSEASTSVRVDPPNVPALLALTNIKAPRNGYCLAYMSNEIVRFAHAIKSNIKRLCVKWGKYVI